MLKITTAFLLGLLCVFDASGGQADQLTKERARRLSRGGRLDSKTRTEFYPAKKSEGVISSAVIRGRQNNGVVKALRLHFAFNADDVNRAGQSGKWKVTVKDLNGNELWEFDSKSESDFDEFWSPQLPVAAVEVSVTSEVPKSVLKLACDKRIEYLEPIQEKSNVGADDTVEFTRVTDPDYLRWGRSVARLTFTSTEEEDVLTCTGFLVASKLFVTNEHCPRGNDERKSAIVEFDYDVENARTKIYRLKAELVRNEELDFAFYELNKPVSDRDALKLGTEVQNFDNPKSLIIIQHPAGLPKRLAAANCHVKRSTNGVQPPTDFGHECDTQGGSSGSPVQNNAGLVIGIHHFGFDPAITDPALQVNQAVKMNAIIDFVKKEKSPKARKVLQLLALPE